MFIIIIIILFNLEGDIIRSNIHDVTFNDYQQCLKIEEQLNQVAIKIKNSTGYIKCIQL